MQAAKRLTLQMPPWCRRVVLCELDRRRERVRQANRFGCAESGRVTDDDDDGSVPSSPPIP